MRQFIIQMVMILAFGVSATAQHSGHDHMQHKQDMKETVAKSKIPTQFRVKLSEAAKVYFELKDALVKGETRVAAEKAVAFDTVLSKAESDAMPDDLKQNWAEHLNDMKVAVKKINAEEDIAKQRAAFYDLSKSLITTTKHYGPLDMIVYVQHCPMAFDNTGGDWLSDSDEILNPYFGKMMLHCGSVTETIGQK